MDRKKIPSTMASSFTGLKSLRLFCHMKQLVYAELVKGVKEIGVRVENSTRTIREMPGIFGRVLASWLRRARVCIDKSGAAF
jgi:hypothetical protein